MKKIAVALCLFLLSFVGSVEGFTQKQVSPSELRATMFNESIAAWDILKKKKGNSYLYTRSFHSFAGFGGITLIRVIEGQVVKRQYDGVKRLEDGQMEMVKWDEYGEEIGSPPQGFAPQTMDELYTQCKEEILSQNPEANRIVFLRDKRGVMQICTYSPKGMVDDNVIGIRINSLQFVN